MNTALKQNAVTPRRLDMWVVAICLGRTSSWARLLGSVGYQDLPN